MKKLLITLALLIVLAVSVPATGIAGKLGGLVIEDTCACGGSIWIERWYRSDYPNVGWWCRNHYESGYVGATYRC